MSNIVPEPLPGGFDYDCGPDKLPGWLNEEGLPTSCVSNEALPGPPPHFTAEPAPVENGPLILEPEADAEDAAVLDPPQVTYPETIESFPTPMPLTPMPDELAMTGPADVALGVILGVLFIASGAMFALNHNKRRNRNE